MAEALAALRKYELWIYILLSLGGIFFIFRFIQAWRELRGAAFGLERDSAQARLNGAASVVVLLLTVAVIQFVLVSFIAPTIPGAIPLLTPTINLLATPTTTLSAVTPQVGVLEPTPLPGPTGVFATTGCIPAEVFLDSPQEGQEVYGVVDIIGTANIANFAFYKLEVKRPQESIWATLQAGNSPSSNGKLGVWDTRRLTPGDYQLSVVVVNNAAETSPRCAVQVRVVLPPPETPAP